MGDATPILPTVGRCVYFKSRGSLDGVFPPRDVASMITRIYDSGEVSVVSFSEEGLRFEVKIKQGQEPGCWDWMPFQKDQQARMEAGSVAAA